jgi:hypothetical protein
MSEKYHVTQLIQLSPAQLRELLRAKVLYVRVGSNVMSESLYTKIRLGNRPRVA